MPGSSPRKSATKRLCPHCQAWFKPHPRNRHHQVFCSQPDCRRQSKASSQERWLQKPANEGYFRGPEQTERVRRWRQNHPGYWRKKTAPAAPSPPAEQGQLALQDLFPEKNAPPTPQMPGALQDLFGPELGAQSTVLVGLLATLSGSALQDDIAAFTGALLRKGRDILGPNSGVAVSSTTAPPVHDQKAPLSVPAAPRPAPV